MGEELKDTYFCRVCGFRGSYSEVVDEIETNHPESDVAPEQIIISAVNVYKNPEIFEKSREIEKRMNRVDNYERRNSVNLKKKKEEMVGLNEERKVEKAEDKEQKVDKASELVPPTPLTRSSSSIDSGLVSEYVTNQLTMILNDSGGGVSGKVATNLQAHITRFNQIQNIITNKKEIQATILVFLLKNKLIYYNLILKIFPQTSNQTIRQTIQSLKNAGLVEDVDKNNGYQKEAQVFERALQKHFYTGPYHIKKIKYYSLTQVGWEIIPKLKEALEAILPKSTIKLITQRSLSDLLGHTQKQHEIKSEDDIKRINMAINEIEKQTSYYYKKQGINFFDELNKRWKNSETATVPESRLEIAKMMLAEASKTKV